MVPKISEKMIPLSNYPTVYDTDCLKDATNILRKYLAEGKEHRSLLVFSRAKKVEGKERLVGVLTIRDILAAIKKNTLSYSDSEVFSFSWAFFYNKDPLKDVLVTQVGEALRPFKETAIQANHDVNDALDMMIKKNVNMLPVFEGKEAVGIIRAVDLMRYVVDKIPLDDGGCGECDQCKE